MEALLGRQVRDDEAGCLETSPTAESDEDHVADRGRDQARQQGRDGRLPALRPLSTSSMPATSGPPNNAEIAENAPALERTILPARRAAPCGARPRQRPTRARSPASRGPAPHRMRAFRPPPARHRERTTAASVPRSGLPAADGRRHRAGTSVRGRRAGLPARVARARRTMAAPRTRRRPGARPRASPRARE